MGRQTSQYSPCISVCDPVYFLYGQCDFLCGQLLTFYIVNSSFYMVNFLLLIRSVFTFYMVKSTFYMVNFYFLYGQVDFLNGQIHFLYGQVDFLYGQIFTFYMIK